MQCNAMAKYALWSAIQLPVMHYAVRFCGMHSARQWIRPSKERRSPNTIRILDPIDWSSSPISCWSSRSWSLILIFNSDPWTWYLILIFVILWSVIVLQSCDFIQNTTYSSNLDSQSGSFTLIWVFSSVISALKRCSIWNLKCNIIHQNVSQCTR